MKIHVIHKLFDWETRDTLWVVSGKILWSHVVVTFKRGGGELNPYHSSACAPPNTDRELLRKFCQVAYNQIERMMEEDADVYFG